MSSPHRTRQLFLAVLLLIGMTGMVSAGDLATTSPVAIVARLMAAAVTGADAAVRPWFTPKGLADWDTLLAREKVDHRLASLETVLSTTVVARTEMADSSAVKIKVQASGGTADWTLVFEDAHGLIGTVAVDAQVLQPAVVAAGPAAAAQPAAPATGSAAPAAADGAPSPAGARKHLAPRPRFSPSPRGFDATFDEALRGGTAHRADAAVANEPSAPESGAPRRQHAARRPTIGADDAAQAQPVIPVPHAPPVVAQAAPPAAPVPLPTPKSIPPVAPPPPAAPAATGPGDITALADPRTVEFLLATTRKTEAGPQIRFTADRSDGLTFATVRVHVPLDHKSGQVERPTHYGFAGFTLYEQKLDEKKHFVVSSLRLLDRDDFFRFATGDPGKEALIFVHGFNNTFEDSAYRFAQILYDIQYDHPAILFSWASRGSVIDYLYDKESAEIARGRFAQLVATLQSRGVEKINVIAHSMGNYLAVAALADSADSTHPDRVEQLIMAAPDIGRDYLTQLAPKLAQVARGMTLYACSTDRALRASMDAAGGVPRAGDVPADGPVVIPGIDTIDVSALGRDWFGLNHDVFATNRSVMDDMFALLKEGRRPPRLAQIKGMPDGATPALFWRFEP